MGLKALRCKRAYSFTIHVVLLYMAISSGYPPLVIKGETKAQRQRYYSALYQFEQQMHADQSS